MQPFESAAERDEVSSNESIETIVPLESKSGERFTRCEHASSELSSRIVENLKQAGVHERYYQEASVFFLPEVLGLESGASLDQVLERAKELNQEVVVYSGGINWRGGKHIHPTEILKPEHELGSSLASFSKELSSDLSHDITIPGSKKAEELPSALNFFADSHKAVVITIDPFYREAEVPASSLRSDAIAKKTSLNAVKNAGIDVEIVNWSDGGFKDMQIQFAGYIAIVEDLRWGMENGILMYEDYVSLEKTFETESTDSKAENAFANMLLKIRQVKGNIQSLDYTPPSKANVKQHLRAPVFLSGYEALSYFESLKDIDDIRGGAPSIPQELAFPFKSTDTNPVIRGPVRVMANEFVGLFGKKESNKILDAVLYNAMPKSTIDQQGNVLVLLRLLELGRGIKGREDMDPNEMLCKLTQSAVSTTRGTGLDITLGDTSGDVVNTASETNGTPVLSQLVNGKKALYIETRDTNEIGKPSIHIEVKRALPAIETIAAADKLGLITDEVDDVVEQRYTPVTLEVSELHPNGSVLHRARKLDHGRWLQINEKRHDLSEKERKLLDKASKLFSE